MLGKKAITEALSNGEIGISYEYDLNRENGEMPIRLPEAASVDPSKPDSSAYRIFDRNFFGDRLGLTLGPIVVSENIRKLRGRVLFKGRKGHFDLSKSEGKIEIMPGESLAVHSIEFIKLSADCAAYILPRLTLATVGLVVVPTYIDPFWEGVLQLYITNESPHPFTLSLGERIAVCRFYRVQGADDDPEIQKQFVRKSHHFGLTWQKILDTDSEVQPRRKRHVPFSAYRERFRERITDLARQWHNVAGIAFGAAFIAAILAYAQFESKVAQIDSNAGKISTLDEEVNQIKVAQRTTASQMPQSGILDFYIGPGEQETAEAVSLQKPLNGPAAVWLAVDPSDQEVQAIGRANCDDGKTNCKLLISIRRSTPSSRPVKGQVKWLIVGQ